MTMVTSLPQPSAPRAALAKSVAMEKQYTVPLSRTGRMALISQAGTLTIRMEMSYSLPPLAARAFSSTSTGSVAEPTMAWWQRFMLLSRSASSWQMTRATTLPVGPTRFMAS